MSSVPRGLSPVQGYDTCCKTGSISALWVRFVVILPKSVFIFQSDATYVKELATRQCARFDRKRALSLSSIHPQAKSFVRERIGLLELGRFGTNDFRFTASHAGILRTKRGMSPIGTSLREQSLESDPISAACWRRDLTRPSLIVVGTTSF